MSRRTAVPPDIRQSVIQCLLDAGQFNQRRLMRDLKICRDTARRDVRRFMQAHPWAFRYCDRRKVYVPTGQGAK